MSDDAAPPTPPPLSDSARWEARVARRTDVLWVRVLLWVIGLSFGLTLVGWLVLFAFRV